MNHIVYAVQQYGTKLMFGVCVAATGTAMLPDTLGLRYIQKVRAAYRPDGHGGKEEAPVGSKMMDLAQDVFDTIRLPPVYETNVYFFSINAQNLFSRGSCQSRTGVIIGVPLSYACDTVEEVRALGFQVCGKVVDPETPAGEKLLKSLCLSERAKKFGLAREIQHSNDNNILVRVFLALGLSLAAYYTGRFGVRVLGLMDRRSIRIRGTLYGGVSLFYFGCFGLLHGGYTIHRHRRADRRAGEISKEYALGGIEFYNKLLEQNMALRTLMGPSGEKEYTAHGNEVLSAVGVLMPEVQVTDRRKALFNIFKQFVEKEEKEKKEREEEEKKEKEKDEIAFQQLQQQQQQSTAQQATSL